MARTSLVTWIPSLLGEVKANDPFGVHKKNCPLGYKGGIGKCICNNPHLLKRKEKKQ